MHELEPAECWTLLAGEEFGRLAVVDGDGRPDVFPMNFIVHRKCIVLRSAPGTKLMSITAHPNVAFEVDGVLGDAHWSVVVRGSTHRLGVDSEIHESGAMAIRSWSPTAKYNYIRVVPVAVTGRRFAVA